MSRRAVMYQMQGLSFREYLYLFHRIPSEIYSLQDIVAHKVEIPGLEHPLPLFHDYLQKGYYPFALEEDFDIRLRQIINLTLESDIPQFADMNVSTGRKLKQLLAIIAKSVPFKPNFSNIAKILEVSRNNISDYCLYIEEAGLIAQLRDATGGIRGLGKVDKIYLDNTNLIYSLAQDSSNIGNIRETFFLNQTRIFSDVVASPVSDFLIDDMTFDPINAYCTADQSEDDVREGLSKSYDDMVSYVSITEDMVESAKEFLKNKPSLHYYAVNKNTNTVVSNLADGETVDDITSYDVVFTQKDDEMQLCGDSYVMIVDGKNYWKSYYNYGGIYVTGTQITLGVSPVVSSEASTDPGATDNYYQIQQFCNRILSLPTVQMTVAAIVLSLIHI